MAQMSDFTEPKEIDLDDPDLFIEHEMKDILYHAIIFEEIKKLKKLVCLYIEKTNAPIKKGLEEYAWRRTGQMYSDEQERIFMQKIIKAELAVDNIF